jgi:hypothetical protein
MKPHQKTCFVYKNAYKLIGVDRRGLCTCGADPDAEADRAKGFGLSPKYVKDYNARISNTSS